MALVEGEPLDLIETLAARVADAVLARPLVEAVEVTVHKPQAPVGVPVRRRRRHDPPRALRAGRRGARRQPRRRRRHPRVGGAPARPACPASTCRRRLAAGRDRPRRRSGPAGLPQRGAAGPTRLAPWTLLRSLHDIEAEHGRVRETRWGARTLDLDLVQYGVPGTPGELTGDDPTCCCRTRARPTARSSSSRGTWSTAEAVLRVGDDVVPVADRLEQLDRAGVRPGPDWRPTW